MRNTIPVCLTAAFAVACRTAPPRADLAIVNVTVVDAEHGALLPARTVLIRGHRILSVDSGSPPLVRETRAVDGTGRFLIPGLWDMHVHLGGNDSAAAQMLAWGLTGARDMGGDLERMVSLRELITTEPLLGPRLVIAGPALGGPESPAATGLGLVRTPEQGEGLVDSLAKRRVNFIKVHEDLPPQIWFAISRAARARNLPLVGHVPASLSPEEAADSGARSIEHFEYLADRCLVLFDSTARTNNQLPPAGCRLPDVRRLLEHLHGSGVWLCPTLGSFRGWAPRQWPSIQAGFGDLVPLIRAVGLPLLAGTDFGDSRFTAGEGLHDELQLLVTAGFSSVEVLRAATYSPAEFLGLTDSLGAVKAGYVADLVLLDGNPILDIRNSRGIAAVIRSGTLLTRDQLAVRRHQH